MSQITRCPSCSTSFKVVADQLRISEGWVRCGQCKEVFDAAAHLLPAAPPPLLPDVSLTDVRPPPAPVVRQADTARAWGQVPPPPQSQPPAGATASATPAPASPLLSGAEFSLLATDSSAAAVPATSVTLEAAPEPVLAVPEPAVPAFLAAGSAGRSFDGELSLHPLTPFSWGASSGSPARHGAPVGDVDLGRPVHVLPSLADEASPVPIAAPVPVPAPAALPSANSAIEEVTVPRAPAGYELPFADLRDEEEALLDDTPPPSFDVTVPAELTPMGYPPLELPAKPVPPATPAPEPAYRLDGDGGPLPLPGTEEKSAGEEDLPSVDFVQSSRPSHPSQQPSGEMLEGLALVEDDSPAAVLLPRSRKAREDAADESEEGQAAEEEVSFVVAARRKAFWRKPVVRTVLVMLMLLATVGLALQVAFQERAHIVAKDARTRPWLAALCGPLHCEIAPQRQIADVVIDSSSFNKARGDSYQLTLAMKSKANIPLAMPAVELTLTDAQDQPVLRRVLLPGDMGAPVELPARGEWSTAVSVIVTTGGARVAGYRLLAFYP